MHLLLILNMDIEYCGRFARPNMKITFFYVNGNKLKVFVAQMLETVSKPTT